MARRVLMQLAAFVAGQLAGRSACSARRAARAGALLAVIKIAAAGAEQRQSEQNLHAVLHHVPIHRGAGGEISASSVSISVPIGETRIGRVALSRERVSALASNSARNTPTGGREPCGRPYRRRARPSGPVAETAAGPEKPRRAIMGGKSSLHLLCLSLSLVCRQTKCRTDIPDPPCVRLDLLPAASGKGNISLPARVSKSNDIFGQGMFIIKQRVGEVTPGPK